jgi:hypothetical protein
MERAGFDGGGINRAKAAAARLGSLIGLFRNDEIKHRES